MEMCDWDLMEWMDFAVFFLFLLRQMAICNKQMKIYEFFHQTNVKMFTTGIQQFFKNFLLVSPIGDQPAWKFWCTAEGENYLENNVTCIFV